MEKDLQIKAQKFVLPNGRELSDLILVRLQGQLNDLNADELSETFKRFVNKGIYKFIVDLSEVARIGSAGLGVFISFIDILEKHKGTFVFVKPNAKIQTTFKMFKLSTFYSVVENHADAIKEIQALSTPKSAN